MDVIDLTDLQKRGLLRNIQNRSEIPEQSASNFLDLISQSSHNMPSSSESSMDVLSSLGNLNVNSPPVSPDLATHTQPPVNPFATPPAQPHSLTPPSPPMPEPSANQSPLSFLDNLAAAAPITELPETAKVPQVLDNTELMDLNVKLDNFDYKMDRFLDRITEIENKIKDFENKVS